MKKYSNKHLQSSKISRTLVNSIKQFKIIIKEKNDENSKKEWLKLKPINEVRVENKFIEDHLTENASKESTMLQKQRGGHPVNIQTSIECSVEDLKQKVMRSGNLRYALTFKNEQQLQSSINADTRTIDANGKTEGKIMRDCHLVGKWIPEVGICHIYHYEANPRINDNMLSKYKQWYYDDEIKKYTSPRVNVKDE